ncbi:MAG: hypothetical protein H8M99_02780 [Gloeobacteraceae cyanobacterium ES-bin-144]|nr:hypothetical protein [Verrucomicrobiales bacterium]
MKLKSLFHPALALTSILTATAQIDPGLPLLGKLKTHSAKEIPSSNWSIGGETLDRDFGVYENYKKYLGPLGAKSIRLQTGWAKCEKSPGVYDFSWLDAIVDDALSQGVQPWLELNYGNPIYPGGGGTNLGGDLPSSPEALAAWDKWVRAIVKRYQNRVTEWEIWNEPDGNKAMPEAYADLFIRTAEIVRSEQPKAKIYALALAGEIPYAEAFMKHVSAAGKLALIDAITIHGYPINPDDTENIIQLRAITNRIGAPIEIRQGESGATSRFQKHFALNNLQMTETIQTKWNLRRMLAHHGIDVPFNLFTIIDLHYVLKTKGLVIMNYKGLLASKPDQTVDYVKPAYLAAQNVFSTFDDSLVRMKDFSAQSNATKPLAAFAYSHQKSGGQIVTLWCKDDMPGNSNDKTLVDFTFQGATINDPVYVDLYNGKVYALPKSADGKTFPKIPLYDSPILIAEKSALQIDFKTKP